MKSKTWTLLFLCFCLSCGSVKRTDNTDIFEKSFGLKNSKDLEKFVQKFEKLVLTPNYSTGDLTEKYKDFAKTCLEKGVVDALPAINGALIEFRETQAWNEIYAQVDSVWTGKYEQLSGRIIYNSEKGTKNIGTTGYPTRRISNLDSLKTSILKWQVWNNYGKYVTALEKVKKGNAFIEEYYQVKTKVGEISSEIFCDMLRRHNPDFENQLIRNIIAVEFALLYVS
ncbi:hypothetical protein [Aureicoccus marinus]|uniref:Uncharacterized protein n=1 Tax=Aureicoccus marinus TaxID=754435 RepID=A0A2S7T8F0_9FLAO|nr:hypothetical protein [Aureicoccus marinus]PQJ15787.1 hypothetical protein BST99_08660 [Aureicoccus marinus]